MNEFIKKLEEGLITVTELKEIMLNESFIKIEKCYSDVFRVTIQYGRFEETHNVELL